ncbi:MAG: hypothetical protein QOF41_143 [Methylobacteriaceae bacterium]|nr:hypothetical protein [Methylobacteriaceae bacterium]
MQLSLLAAIESVRRSFVGADMQSVDNRRSPFFSAVFLRRLQKMIPSRRGPASEVELAIERTLRRLASIFTALGR